MTPHSIRVAAYGLIQRDDALLLCRLSPVVPDSNGKWTLPGGGLEYGESAEAAMRREVKEETGLKVIEATLIGVDTLNVQRNGQCHQGIRLVYRALVEDGPLQVESQGSTDACQWWPQGELARMPLVDLVKTALPWLDTP